MLRMRSVAFSLVGLLAFAAGTSHADVGDELADFMARMESYGFSGAVLVAKDGEVLLEDGYGAADRTRGLEATADTAFSVGSITKQFTAAAILHLEMAGKLSTSDSLAKHLDFIPDDRRGVTIHHALTHTSGVADDYWDQNPNLSEFEYLKLILGRRATSPGQRYRYSNAGYHLLKAVVERVSGVSYEEYLRDHLFVPLGMEHTGHQLPNWDDGQVATYRDWTTRAWSVPVAEPVSRPIYLQPEGSGGLLSTVGDMYRWYCALQSGGVLSEAAREKFFTPNLNDYAYGWRIGETARGTAWIHHGGYDTSIGTVAGLYMYPDEDAVIIMLANTTMNLRLDHPWMVNYLERILFGQPVDLPPAAVEVDEPDLDSFAGTYVMPNGARLELSVVDNRLVASVEDETAIRLLFLPNSGAPHEQSAAEDTFAKFFEHIDRGQFDQVAESLSSNADAGRFERLWKNRWKRMVESNGAFKSARHVHLTPNANRTQSNELHFALLEFERHSTVYMGVRDNSGWVQFRQYALPKRVELTLARTGPNEFAAWDYLLRSGPRIEIAGAAGSRALTIRGSSARTVALER